MALLLLIQCPTPCQAVGTVTGSSWGGRFLSLTPCGPDGRPEKQTKRADLKMAGKQASARAAGHLSCRCDRDTRSSGVVLGLWDPSGRGLESLPGVTVLWDTVATGQISPRSQRPGHRTLRSRWPKSVPKHTFTPAV